MVVYTVREPHSLKVCLQRLVLCRRAVAFVAFVYSFEHFAYAQIVASELVGCYVASAERCLGEVVYV